ncbi:MAG TPA: sugar ABC transporter permease [Acidimicrobiales bacterium]|nr:sugar ABC transporter permease [Acidimicrobiales bacterium]
MATLSSVERESPGAAPTTPGPGGRGPSLAARAKRLVTGKRAAPYWLVLPFVLGFALFSVFPILWSVLLSFEHWTMSQTTWVGLANYRYVLSTPAVGKAFLNIVWFAVVNDVFQIVIALVLSLLLTTGFMRKYSLGLSAAMFLPNVVPGAAVAVLFSVLLGTNGLVPSVLSNIGIHINWLDSTTWSKPAVILAGSWQWIGFWVLVLVAALRAVPADYYEAARVDGAGLLRRMWSISIPIIRPALIFVISVNTIGTMQLFDVPFLLFGQTPGGPDNSATTPVVQLYQYAFSNADLGSAAAIGWVLTFAIVVVTLAFLVVARRKEWI